MIELIKHIATIWFYAFAVGFSLTLFIASVKQIYEEEANEPKILFFWLPLSTGSLFFFTKLLWNIL